MSAPARGGQVRQTDFDTFCPRTTRDAGQANRKLHKDFRGVIDSMPARRGLIMLLSAHAPLRVRGKESESNAKTFGGDKFAKR